MIYQSLTSLEKFTWRSFLFLIIFGCTSHIVRADDKVICPETLLFDFKRSVPDQETATRLFKQFFAEVKGYPAFDSKQMSGPYLDDPAVPRGTYSYFGWYGHGESKVGGLLYPDGRLVQRGYCK